MASISPRFFAALFMTYFVHRKRVDSCLAVLRSMLVVAAVAVCLMLLLPRAPQLDEPGPEAASRLPVLAGGAASMPGLAAAPDAAGSAAPRPAATPHAASPAMVVPSNPLQRGGNADSATTATAVTAAEVQRITAVRAALAAQEASPGTTAAAPAGPRPPVAAVVAAECSRLFALAGMPHAMLDIGVIGKWVQSSGRPSGIHLAKSLAELAIGSDVEAAFDMAIAGIAECRDPQLLKALMSAVRQPGSVLFVPEPGDCAQLEGQDLGTKHLLVTRDGAGRTLASVWV
ncbi:hypothetical protein HK105_206325 [Polyrhizophydium stewartii]|uniref:Uncharacterized protein n=1 Tax=Polyrhizophydium stewartii TaxID=2732419 RepID=A0ABR4N3E5_9FUNG